MSTSKNELKCETGLFSAIPTLMGTVTGSGIFTMSGKIVASVGSIGPTILAWLIAGAGAVLCASIYTELSPAIPKAGGSCIYINEAFSHCASFVCGWSMILGFFLPVMAMIASAFISNFAVLFPRLNLSITGECLVTTALILILARVSSLGAKNGSAVQNILTVAKITILVVASVGGLLALKPKNFMTMTTETVEWGNPFATAVPALVAMRGYYTLSYMSGEIKSPKRNLPLTTIISMGIIIIIDILLTVACVGSVGFTNLADSITPAGDTAQVAFGSSGVALITLGATASIFGSTNDTLLSFPRVAYAMAKNHMMFSFFSKLHPKYKIPYITTLVYAAGVVMFIWIGNFVMLLMVSTFIGCLSEVTMYLPLSVLRKKQPDMKRPFKMQGYLVTAILATAITMILACSVSIREITSGSLLMLTSIPAYFIFLYTRNRKQPSTADQ